MLHPHKLYEKVGKLTMDIGFIDWFESKKQV